MAPKLSSSNFKFKFQTPITGTGSDRDKIPDKRNQHPLHKPAPSIFPRPNPRFRKEMFGILAERVNIRLTYVYDILILNKFCYFCTGKGDHLWGEGPAPLKP